MDQVTADLLMFRTNLDQRQYLGRAHNGGVHARLTAIVQEDRIEHNAGRRGEAKAHIADPEDHMHPR